MRQLQPVDSVSVYVGFFKHRLPNGSYVEWLESLGAPVRKLYFYASLQVCTFQINEIDEEWVFIVTGDDCILAKYSWNTRTQKLICESAFVDDDEYYVLTVEEFNERLHKFCEEYRLTPKYM